MRLKNIEKFIEKNGLEVGFYNNEDEFIKTALIIILTDFLNNTENKYEKFGLPSKNYVKAYSLKTDFLINRGSYFKVDEDRYYVNSYENIFFNNKIICVEYSLSKEE